jgi:hypothetical protein
MWWRILYAVPEKCYRLSVRHMHISLFRKNHHDNRRRLLGVGGPGEFIYTDSALRLKQNWSDSHSTIITRLVPFTHLLHACTSSVRKESGSSLSYKSSPALSEGSNFPNKQFRNCFSTPPGPPGSEGACHLGCRERLMAILKSATRSAWVGFHLRVVNSHCEGAMQESISNADFCPVPIIALRLTSTMCQKGARSSRCHGDRCD